MSIGERIYTLRKENNLTQDELSQKIGVTKQTIFKYESGIINNIPSDKIELLANIFDCSPSYLMCWTDEKALLDFNYKKYLSIEDKLPKLSNEELKQVSDYIDFLIKRGDIK